MFSNLFQDAKLFDHLLIFSISFRHITIYRIFKEPRRKLEEPLASKEPKLKNTIQAIFSNFFGDENRKKCIKNDLSPYCFSTRWAILFQGLWCSRITSLTWDIFIRLTVAECCCELNLVFILTYHSYKHIVTKVIWNFKKSTKSSMHKGNYELHLVNFEINELYFYPWKLVLVKYRGWSVGRCISNIKR